ncbi:MAG: hypothetical protein IJ612_06220 [Prevotella sp.]|nr:hypothetical protein [Prevotella sp.]
MTQDEMNTVADQALARHSRRHGLVPFRDEGRLRKLRFWLNVVFMLGAVAGMALYFTSYRELAVYILIASSVLKFIEATLRIMNL